jgi:hypothetical protein
LAEFNREMETTCVGFEAVQPPSRNIRSGKLDSISQHLDGYSHGLLPIEGGLTALPVNHKIQIFVEGSLLGEAE